MEELEFKILEELLQYIASVGQEELTKIEGPKESINYMYRDEANKLSKSEVRESPYPNESGASSLVVTNKVNVGPEDFEELTTGARVKISDLDQAREDAAWNDYIQTTLAEEKNTGLVNSGNSIDISPYSTGTSFTPYIPGSCGSTIYAHSIMPREVTITLKRNGIHSNREYLKKVAKLLELLDSTNWEVVDYFVDGNTNRD